VIAILKQGEAGLPTAELCRQHGITEQTYYRWKAKYGGMENGEAKKLKQLEEENRKLKHVVAELTLDNRALKDVLSKTSSACGTSGSRRLRDGAVRHERAARLQADGVGTINPSLSTAESGRDAALRARLKELALTATPASRPISSKVPSCLLW
jgi:putative transposase